MELECFIWTTSKAKQGEYSMKFVSWNVNGIRACVKKGFLDYFHEADADIFCIQESKLQEGQIDLQLDGYEQYWNYAERKGYSGTAVFTRKNLFLFATALEIRKRRQRVEALSWNSPIFTWSIFIHQTQKGICLVSSIDCNGKKSFESIFSS